MVAGKPATNNLLLTSQQTGTVQPGQSVHVSVSFVATSVGRWTHELAVRNLGNKHDQASFTIFFFLFSVIFWSFFYATRYLFVYFSVSFICGSRTGMICACGRFEPRKPVVCNFGVGGVIGWGVRIGIYPGRGSMVEVRTKDTTGVEKRSIRQGTGRWFGNRLAEAAATVTIEG